MSKYFIKNEAGQEGPFTLEELKTKGISASTAIMQEGTENWTTAGELEELKALFTAQEAPGAAVLTETTLPAATAPVENEVKPVIAATVTAATTVSTTAATPSPVPVAAATRKSGSAFIGWILSFAAIGGTGYYVYQDMEKNKNSTVNSNPIQHTDSLAPQDETVHTNPDTTAIITTEIPVPDTAAVVSTEPVTTNITTTPTTTAKDPAALKKAEEDKKKLLAAQAKKKEDEKKRLNRFV